MKQLFCFKKSSGLAVLASLLFSFQVSQGFAQNLVLNPSFENVNVGSLQCSWYTTVPQFNNAINNWTLPTGGSTDIFNTALATTCYCSPFSTNASSVGQQAPHTGNGFVNIVTYGNGGCTPWREYIQGQLSTPLVAGNTYQVEFWVSLADKMSVGTNNIGVKFLTAPHTQASNCPYYTTPDLNYTGPIILDKANWTLISFCYTPTQSGITHFVIGNFFNDGATATAPASGVTTGNTIRYFVDDVSIVNVSTGTANAGTNGTVAVCPTDPVFNLFDFLGGTPDATGTWTGPSAVSGGHLGTFNPSTNASGVYTYTVTPSAGACIVGTPATATVTVTAGSSNSTITPAGPFCEQDAAVNLSAVDPGGSWSGTGITNAANGTFNPATAGPGTHTITYAIGGACPSSSTSTITVNPNANATIVPAGPFCDTDAPINLSGADPGGSWSGTGITNAANGTFDPATAGAGTHTITYTIGGTCGDVQTTNIVVTGLANTTISAAGPFCDTDAAINLTSVDPGGTWTGTGITNASNGTFDPAVAGTGTHNITYTIAGACGNSSNVNILVNPQMDATITPVGPFCDNDAAVNLTAVGGGGVWSGTGITNAANGTFDPATAGAGTHTITYTIGGTCGDVQTTTITVNPLANTTISAAGPFCDSNAPVNLTSVDPGGTWSGTGVTNAANGTFDPATAGVGTHNITYTIGGACGTSSNVNILVNPQMDATITPAGPFCDDVAAVNMTAVDGGGIWSGTGITNTTNGTFDPAVAGAGTHTITYTIAGACGDIQTTDIVVNHQADASITPAGPFCELDVAINLVGAETGGIWTGTGITNANNGTFDPGMAGAGTFTITYDIATVCSDVQTTTITVNPLLDATITPVGPFCPTDASVQLTAVDAGGSWSGTGITDVLNGTFDPAAAGPGTQTITYTIPGACGDVQTTDIVVNSIDNPTINPAGPFCQGTGSSVLTAVTAGGTWSGNGIVNASTGEFDPVTAGTGTHTITYVTSGPCPSTGTIDLVVMPVLTVAAFQDATLCEGQSVDLTSNAAGGDGNISYSWVDNNANNVGTVANITVAPMVTTTYTVTASDGCGTTPVSDGVTITVNPNPVINFSGDNLIGCVPMPVNFTNSSTPSGTNCSWDFGDGTTDNACGVTSHTYTASGCYDVTLTVEENGCSSTSTVQQMICLYDQAIADFGLSPAQVDIENTEVSFTNESVFATEYQWDFGDGSGSIVENPTHSFPPLLGNYTICLKAMNAGGCNDSTCNAVTVTEQLIFYVPNIFTPDGDEFNEIFQPVFTSGFDIYDFHLTIFDRWGEVLFESYDATKGWNGQYGNGGLVDDGVYIWKVDFKSNQSDERQEHYGHVTVLK